MVNHLPQSGSRVIEPDSLQPHLNRIAGQIEGIKKMIEENADSIGVVQQIMAAKSGLEKLGVRILKEEAKVCNKAQVDKIVDSLFRLS